MILSHQTNLSEGIEQLKGANLALQAREKELLAAHGYPADYLEMHYVCPICKDTGFADGKRCRCFEDLLRRERLKELNQVSDLELCSFDTFDLNYYSTEVDAATGVVPRTIMGNIYRFCRSYAENFTPESRGLFLIGDTGLGKTHLSLAIAKDVISKGCMVAYGSAQDFLRAVEEEHFGRSEGKETLDGLLDVDLLILDDLGAEFSSSFNLSTILIGWYPDSSPCWTACGSSARTSVRSAPAKDKTGKNISPSRLQGRYKRIFSFPKGMILL